MPAPTRTGTAGFGTANSADHVTFAVTVPSDADCAVIDIGFLDGTSQSITGVTVDGVAATAIGSVTYTNGYASSMWRLLMPHVGTVNVIVSGSAGTMYFNATAYCLKDVDQTTPTGTYASASDLTSTPTVDVTSVSGALVVDCLCFYVAGRTVAVGAGQTEQYNSPGSIGSGSSIEAGAATTTMSWAVTGGATYWALGAVSFNGATGGGTDTGGPALGGPINGVIDGAVN